MSGYQLKAKNQASKVIHINSKDADAYLEENEKQEKLHTNFIYNLTEKLNVSQSQMSLVSLYSATIPHSFYNVRKGVNDLIPILIAVETAGNGGINLAYKINLQLQDGNYDTDELIYAFLNGERPTKTGFNVFNTSNPYKGINNQEYTIDIAHQTPLDANGNSMVGRKFSEDVEFDIEYNAIDNKFYFHMKYKDSTPKKIVKFQMDFIWFSQEPSGFKETGSTDQLANALYGFTGKINFPIDVRGFVKPDNLNNVFAICNDVIEGQPIAFGLQQTSTMKSEIVIDLNDNIHGLMLKTNLVSKGSMSSDTATFSNILARIPITTIADVRDYNADISIQGGIIYFNPNNAIHQNLVDLYAINKIGIKLTDDKGRTIDLNGLDFQIALLIQFVDKSVNQLPPPSRQDLENINPPTKKASVGGL